jgi:hypothetical protein
MNIAGTSRYSSASRGHCIHAPSEGKKVPLCGEHKRTDYQEVEYLVTCRRCISILKSRGFDAEGNDLNQDKHERLIEHAITDYLECRDGEGCYNYSDGDRLAARRYLEEEGWLTPEWLSAKFSTAEVK